MVQKYAETPVRGLRILNFGLDLELPGLIRAQVRLVRE